MLHRITIVASVLVVIAAFVWYASPAGAQKIVTEGLVSFWTLDNADIEGDKVKDLVGNNHGAIQGKPKIVQGKIKEALQFNGSTDFVDCGSDKSLDITGPITIEVWIQPKTAGEGGNNAGPVCKADAATTWSWQLRYNAPGSFMGFQFNAGGSTWISVKENLKPGEWYHITGTFDGKEIKCYLNGVEKDKGKITAITGGTSKFFIGQDGWVNVFNGVIDEVRIYNRALTADEVQHNFKATSQLAVEPAYKLPITWGKIRL